MRKTDYLSYAIYAALAVFAFAVVVAEVMAFHQ